MDVIIASVNAGQLLLSSFSQSGTARVDMHVARQHIHSCTLVATYGNGSTEALMHILPTIVTTKEVALLHCLFVLSVSAQPSHAQPFKPLGQNCLTQALIHCAAIGTAALTACYGQFCSQLHCTAYLAERAWIKHFWS